MSKYTEIIDPQTPAMQELAANIRAGIETHGWDKFEALIVESADLILVNEEQGRRFYESANGEMKIVFSLSEIDTLA